MTENLSCREIAAMALNCLGIASDSKETRLTPEIMIQSARCAVNRKAARVIIESFR